MATVKKNENLVKNDYKLEFQEMYDYLSNLTKVFADAGIKNLFTEKQLRTLKYVVTDCEQINEDAFFVLMPTFERIRDFCDAKILCDDPSKTFILAQLVGAKSIYRGGVQTETSKKGLIEEFRGLISEYLPNPTKVEKPVLKTGKVVTPARVEGVAFSEEEMENIIARNKKGKKRTIKENPDQINIEITDDMFIPREELNKDIAKKVKVFTLSDKDELVKPNQTTWDALLALQEEYEKLVRADIEPADEEGLTAEGVKNPSNSLVDQLQRYESSKVLLKKDDDKIRKNAIDLTEKIKNYRKEKDTTLGAIATHEKTRRRIVALKGNITKVSNKQDDIVASVEANGKKLDEVVVPTEPIAENNGKNK